MVELSETQRRTGHRSSLVLPVSTSIQPKTTAASKSQVSGASKLKIDESANERIPQTKASSQAEVKPVVQSQPPPKSEKRAISKVSRPKREQPDIFKSFSKPKSKPSKEDTENSAGTSPVVTTTPSVRHCHTASSYLKLKTFSKRALVLTMTVRVSFQYTSKYLH